MCNDEIKYTYKISLKIIIPSLLNYKIKNYSIKKTILKTFCINLRSCRGLCVHNFLDATIIIPHTFIHCSSYHGSTKFCTSRHFRQSCIFVISQFYSLG